MSVLQKIRLVYFVPSNPQNVNNNHNNTATAYRIIASTNDNRKAITNPAAITPMISHRILVATIPAQLIPLRPTGHAHAPDEHTCPFVHAGLHTVPAGTHFPAELQ